MNEIEDLSAHILKLIESIEYLILTLERKKNN